MLLDACQTHKVSLRLALAPSVTLPPALTAVMAAKPVDVVKKSTIIPQHTRCIESTDTDVSIQQLLAGEAFKQALVIDVSEVASSDLLQRLDSRFDTEKLTFHFSEQQGALSKALDENRPVILKGVISEELRDGLSPLLFKRSQQDSTTLAPLVILSEQPLPFTLLPVETHRPSLQDKKALLKNHAFDDDTIEKHRLCELQARQRHQQISLSESDPWSGLESLPTLPKTAFLSLDKSVEEARAFNQKRMDGVTASLVSSPYVFLAGMTGVGKTTFIQENIPMFIWARKACWHGQKIPVLASKPCLSMKPILAPITGASLRGCFKILPASWWETSG
jgi:hypothetical protein